MAISVVGLHYAFAPAAADVVFEGERHALVVRYATRVEQAYGAEPRIERLSRKTAERRNGGESRVGSERTAKSVYAVAIHQVVNAVVSVIGHVKGGVLAQGLVDFQAPFLKLSNLGRRVGAEQTRRREVRNIRLDLSQRLVVLEAVDQSHVAGGCLGKQVAAVKSFAGGNVAPGDDERVDSGRVGSKVIREHSRKRIVEKSHSSANHRAVRAKGRPRETEPRLPQNRAQALQLLVQSLQHIGAVRRVDVVIGQQKRSVEAVKAVGLAYRVGFVLDSKSEGQGEVRFYFPVVFSIEREGIESDWLRQSRGKTLLQN